MSKFSKGDRVTGYVPCHTSILGTVDDPETPYKMVRVLWDDHVDLLPHEDLVYPHDLEILTPEAERTADLEEAERLLAKHGLAMPTGIL